MEPVAIPYFASTSLAIRVPQSLLQAVKNPLIPSASELLVLNIDLGQLLAATQTRTDNLRRDAKTIQTIYARIKSKKTSGKSALTSSEAESKSIYKSIVLPPQKQRRVEADTEDDNEPKLNKGHTTERATCDNIRRPSINVIPRVTPILPRGDLDLDATPTDQYKRLCVASFPSSDLADLLPGKPAEDDFSKQKTPAQQVPINVYYSTLEPVFRSFTEEDLGWLREQGDRVSPFTIPPLGVHYSDAWADSGEPPLQKRELTQRAIESADGLTEESLYNESVSCGPLTSRLLSCLLREEDDTVSGEEGEVQDATRTPKSQMPKLNYPELEHRLTTELAFAGLLDSSHIDWDRTFDDDISSQLRSLQAQLRSQSLVNIARKARLMDLTIEEMAYDEYSTILDDLDKQVEQAFLKRNRSIKAKKRKVANEKGLSYSKMAVGSTIRAVLERRKKWVEKVGVIFKGGSYGTIRSDGIYGALDPKRLEEGEREF